MHRMKNLFIGMAVIICLMAVAINVQTTSAAPGCSNGSCILKHTPVKPAQDAENGRPHTALDLARLQSYDTILCINDQFGYDLFAWRGKQKTGNVFHKKESTLDITYPNGNTMRIPFDKIRHFYTFNEKPPFVLVKNRYLKGRPSWCVESICMRSLNELAAKW